jgi:D-alanyl-lipoteichoic acid acyltransferase DltB (MBOAT superfamily)
MLGVVSSVLLFSESKITFLVFLYVLLVSWGASKAIVSLRCRDIHRRSLICIFVILQLLPLVFFKYAGFFASIFGYEYDYYEGYIIPVGISFYSFQLIGYVVDLYKQNGSSARFRDEYNFACFFPQIVAGPIERKEDLLPQIKAFTLNLKRQHVEPGLKMVIAGMFYKLVMGDNLAAVSDWSTEATNNPFVVWGGSFLFGLRIYFDFAGYSMIAVGLGRIFGIQLTQNFNSPYTAVNIQQFWSRWHLTLSTWFRDYVYIPLGGGRCGRWWVNTLVVFIVSGLWHGAGWNFIIWGGWHGVMLIIYKIFYKKIWVPSIVGWSLNMICITLSWLFFYETSTSQLMIKIAVVFTPDAYTIASIKDFVYAFGTGLDFCAAMLITGTAIFVIILEFIGMRAEKSPYWYWRSQIVCCFAVVLIYLCAPSEKTGFIYFNF